MLMENKHIGVRGKREGGEGSRQSPTSRSGFGEKHASCVLYYKQVSRFVYSAYRPHLAHLLQELGQGRTYPVTSTCKQLLASILY